MDTSIKSICVVGLTLLVLGTSVPTATAAAGDVEAK